MPWTTLHLRVVTPLFGGDDAGNGTPIRVPSIRGALRYWFRAIAAGHGVTDLGALWRAECEVFGSTATPAPISLRIDDQVSAAGRGSGPSWASTQGGKYLLGQGLWESGRLSRPFVEPGTQFALRVRFSGDADRDRKFTLALWAWLNYGGLGARTRRGFGRLRCDDVDGVLPPGWTATDLRAPRTVQAWQRLLGEEVVPARHRMDSGDWPGWLVGDPAADESLPEVSTLSPRWWAGTVLDDRPRSLADAFDSAGKAWRAYRAEVPERNVSGRGVNTPEWRISLHPQPPRDDRYPIAALGLPVNYHSPQIEYDGVVEPVINDQAARRASPVWICPCQVDKGWISITHIFYARLLPDGASLRVTKSGKNRGLLVPDAETTELAWDNWLDHRTRHQRVPDDYRAKQAPKRTGHG